MSVSVLILTKNEERDLRNCLASVAWSDDVWVLDSESEDKTVDIATAWGARVRVRPFDGFASQRNFGLHEFSYKYQWLLILDADERVTDVLREELLHFVKHAPETVAAGRIQRRDFFMNRWLRHAQISPLFVRLVRHASVKYEREINEVMMVNGEIASISGYLDHFPFSKGISHWVQKHNIYSSMEAIQLNARHAEDVSIGRALFSNDFNERRRYQKALFYRLPCRPLIKFIYMMFVRRAFLDGIPGLNYSILQCFYEYLISIKAVELKSK